MPIPGNIFSYFLIFSGAVSLTLSLRIFRQNAGIVFWYGLIMLATSFWAIGYGFELLASKLGWMLFFIKIEYIGIATLPGLWIVFVLHFISKEKWLNFSGIFFVFLIPAITLLLVFTNSYHHLYYESTSVDRGGPFPLLELHPGFWYYINTAFFYATLSWGLLVIIYQFRDARGIYKSQRNIILVGTIIPWLVNFLYLIHFRPFRHLDLTPFAFILTSLIIGFGLLRYRLFDIIPVAREKVFEAMQESILVLDIHSRVIDFNTGMKKILHQMNENIIGKKLSTLFTEDINASLDLAFNSKTKADICFQEDEPRWFEVTTSSIFQKEGIYSGRILLFREITEEKKYAEKLLSLNKLKDRIFSIIAHDLRTPLISLAEILRMTEDGMVSEKELSDYLPKLSKNIGYTSELVDNLLLWSLSQLGGTTFTPVSLNVHEIANQTINLFSHRAHEKHLMIENQVSLELVLQADRDMLFTVLRNLLGNAIKFSNENGKISIISSVSSDFATLQVQDEGAGIAKHNIHKLFSLESFSTTGTRNEKGTGLGLLLCKDFISRHDGEIWVESELGKGSCFSFSLPLGNQANNIGFLPIRHSNRLPVLIQS